MSNTEQLLPVPENFTHKFMDIRTTFTLGKINALKVCLGISFILFSGNVLSAHDTAWGHLIFNAETNPVEAIADSGGEQGKSIAVLVSPEDNKEREHRKNSILADVSFLEYAPGGKARLQPSEESEETLLIVADGTADIQIGKFKSSVEKENLILVPVGETFTAKVTGDTPLRLVKSVWPVDDVATKVKPVVRSEAENPFSYYSEGGYVTVSPSPRQKDTGLIVVGAGGHTKLSAALMFYPEDLEVRNNFKANSLVIKSALSQYGVDGGTPAHSHHDREQAFYILSGRAILEIGSTTKIVEPGDLVFAPKHVSHGYKVIGEKPLKFIEMEWSHLW